jgi:hypothetical protein
MAAGQIYKGKNVRISYEGKTLYHTTSCKLDVSTSLEEIATKDTDGTVQTPGNYTWNLSAEALMADIPSGSTTQIAGDDLLDYQLAGTELDVEFSTNEVASYKYTGKVYVESTSIDATVGQSVTGSFAFKGNGNLTKETISA